MPETIPLTAAELVRRKHANSKIISVVEESNTSIDIDDEIRRLEAELKDMSEEDSSSDSSDVDESDSRTEAVVQVLALSSVKDERIERLPTAALPAPPKKRKSDETSSRKGSNNKRKRNTSAPTVSQGLTEAVQEVLRGYKPRSAEHLPFYCRCCAKQYDNLEQFQDHKSTEFHKAAVELERKASFCKLCRKQLTSPAQLQEHLKSRPHHERLQTLRSRQHQLRKR